MDKLPKYDFPWELISESFSESFSDEKEQQLQQWFQSNPEHRVKYLEIQEMWKNGMEDYQLYKKADENASWNALRQKMGKSNLTGSDSGTVQLHKFRNPFNLRYIIAIAAVFIGLVGTGWWYMLHRNMPLIYETAVGVEKKIVLKDGTVVSLKHLTKIEISRDYNKSERIVRMYTGEACFDVKHQLRKPFRVKLGSTDIQDIGTTFTVRKGEKVINVSVSEGKVVFERIGTKDSREITAGASIEYDVQKASFGTLKFSDASKINKEQWMNFSNTPLSQVISSIQKEYGKKVVLTNTDIENKKLTARLNGMSFNTALLVICKSLSLEYVMHDSVYVLKEKK